MAERLTPEEIKNALIDANKSLHNRIEELEEALRRIHRECFDNLSAPGTLKHRTLMRVMQECESVVETPNFGDALSREPSKEVEGG